MWFSLAVNSRQKSVFLAVIHHNLEKMAISGKAARAQTAIFLKCVARLPESQRVRAHPRICSCCCSSPRCAA